MKTEKLVQYGFFFSIFLSLVFFLKYSDPAGLNSLKSDGRFTTSMQLYKQFGKKIDDSEPPVIGILTQGTTDKAYYNDYTMIAASYVRYIEAAGGKVVAVPYNLDESELERIYQNINGLLIPGGRTRLIIPVNKTDNSSDAEMKTSMFANAARFFVNRAIEDFSKGVYFPIFGICLGQEAIALAINRDVKHTLTFLNLTANKYQESAGPLDIDVKSAYKSRLFDTFTESEIESIEGRAKFFYHHKYGVLQKTFDESEELKKHIIPLTSKVDHGGNKYITSFEMYNYPIYGVQFHPEKSSFEWSIKTDRSPETISITHKLGANFVKECRKNNHKVEDIALVKNLTVYKHVMMGPKNGYSQLFYMSKETVREIMDYKEPVNQTNQTEGVVQSQQSTVPVTQANKFLGRRAKKSFLHDLQEIVAKLETIEQEHVAHPHVVQDKAQEDNKDDIVDQIQAVDNVNNMKAVLDEIVEPSKEDESVVKSVIEEVNPETSQVNKTNNRALRQRNLKENQPGVNNKRKRAFKVLN